MGIKLFENTTTGRALAQGNSPFSDETAPIEFESLVVTHGCLSARNVSPAATEI
jgi:hypothetical protein